SAASISVFCWQIPVGGGSYARARERPYVLPGVELKLGNAMSRTIISLLATALLAISADDPPFVTSDRNGGWSTGGYYVHNNMWNSAKYSPCTSTLHARSHDNWYVITRMNNKKGDGAVKTYPNVHRDYKSVPISSFDAMTSRFAETSPHV